MKNLKKKPNKYDITLKIKGGLVDVLRASVQPDIKKLQKRAKKKA